MELSSEDIQRELDLRRLAKGKDRVLEKKGTGLRFSLASSKERRRERPSLF
jgi:hypothetical protein